jgi:hypothetical protein
MPRSEIGIRIHSYTYVHWLPQREPKNWGAAVQESLDRLYPPRLLPDLAAAFSAALRELRDSFPGTTAKLQAGMSAAHE